MNGLSVDLGQDAPIPLAASFSCATGEVLALVGPSGSGKSTILRSIAGTYRPQHGTVRVNDETWFSDAEGIHVSPQRRAVGMVFQSYALFPHMTALGNVMTAMGRLPAREQDARARKLLELVHLSGLERRRPAELSGGQQQRVAVARALARAPKVLLLDEPFSAVDTATRQRLYREIAELRRALNMPVVLVTHDLDEAVMLADRMAVLHHGRTLQAGRPEEVTTRPASAEVARLVGLRNLFQGTVVGHDRSARTIIEWSGRKIEAAARSDLAPGQKVSWAVPDGFVLLHRRDRPSRGEHENPVPGIIETMLVIGQTAHLTLRPRNDPGLPLHFSVPLHVARRNGIAEGVEAAVSLLAEGIHLMTPPAAAEAG
ncbi:ABC transporter [Maritimibacter sp. 55A14]|uniref:ABC transporter ATP-binding protein n=1 Tax=Maritimibacter sp. 55A14 TaxID=2174844 RepID=UPI000D60F40A|nr:ABC transporter ATP-binding protein [Maritimibacter sp. 55A14]PWE32616.1 ABC transporter [Maritimibacter sp. 55A14]